MTRDDDSGCMSLSLIWACASGFPLLKKKEFFLEVTSGAKNSFLVWQICNKF